MTHYFSEVGSYRGCVLMRGRWVSVKDLNKINKRGWKRHQGPATNAMQSAMLHQPLRAEQLFPHLITSAERAAQDAANLEHYEPMSRHGGVVRATQ